MQASEVMWGVGGGGCGWGAGGGHVGGGLARDKALRMGGGGVVKKGSAAGDGRQADTTCTCFPTKALGN